MSGRQGKPPAFQFYPADWLADANIAAMEPAEEGCYIRLLCFDWREDGLPDDMDVLARYCRIDPITFQTYWARLSPCFVAHPKKDGHVTNKRLQLERKEQRRRRRAMSQGGKRGARKRWHGNDVGVHEEAITTPLPSRMASDSSASASASATASTKMNSTAARVLTRCNERREQLGLRQLGLIERNLKPIRARLAEGTTPEQLELAWLGASVSEWVTENSQLTPIHVYRPANIERYIDAGEKAIAKRRPKKQRKATINHERLQCQSCEKHYMVELRTDQPKPKDWTCPTCKELTT